MNESINFLRQAIPGRLSTVYGAVLKQYNLWMSFNMKASAFDGFDTDGMSGMYEDGVIYVNITYSHIERLVRAQDTGDMYDTITKVLEFYDCIFAHELGHAVDVYEHHYDRIVADNHTELTIARMYYTSEVRAYMNGKAYIAPHLEARYDDLNMRNMQQYKDRLNAAYLKGGVFA